MKWGFRFELDDPNPRGRAGWLLLVVAAFLAGFILGALATVAAVHARPLG